MTSPTISPNPDSQEIELSVVIPCLNESDTLAGCVRTAQTAIRENRIAGEVIVADNGSNDGSVEIALKLGARLVRIPAKGYGSALMGGIAAARGKFIIMGDADDSYDFTNLQPFVVKLREGFDLVMGNRFKGGIKPGAMPPLHRYLGNPVLTGIGRLFFHSACGDFLCGLRAFSKEAAIRLDLRTTGMEFGSEMVVKATLHGMRITEVPTTLSPDGRSRPPHLRSWRDGWRNLRFLLLYSPRWLFLYPGILLMLLGSAIGLWLLPGPRAISGLALDVHTLLYAAAAVFIGFQAVAFSAFTKVFAITTGLLPADPSIDRLFRLATLERGLAIGAFMSLLGFLGSLYAVGEWQARAFGDLDPQRELRIVIPSVLFLVLGCQTILCSFFLSVLGLARR